MSRITDIANAEADEAEAAEPEEAETPAEDETPAEPDAAAAPAVDPEKALKAMEKENVRHAAAVQRIMGADFDLVYPCQSCADFAAGFTFTAPDDREGLKRDPRFEPCDKCNGRGKVDTGAAKDATWWTTCVACNGQGYKEIPPTPVAAFTPVPVEDTSAVAQAANLLRTSGFMVIDPPAPAQAG